MLTLQPIWIFLLGILTLSNSLQDSEPPPWTNAEPTVDTFVVKTKEFPTLFSATESLLPAVKKDVTSWAVEIQGEDSRSIVAAIPLEEFRMLIEEDLVYKFGRDYDDETAKRLEVDHDDFYVGYVRVHIHDSFREQIEQRLDKLRLKNRLGTTLVAAIFGLGLLTVLWAYVFTCQLTRGLYISRLRWLAGLLIGILIVICYTVHQLCSA